jgi:hypothetical protein
MPTTIAHVLQTKSDDLPRVRSLAMSMASWLPLVRGQMAVWRVVAILGAIVLTLAWLFPPASSYRVAYPAVQWITGL